MTTYVCTAFDAANQCTSWVAQSNFINELSSMTYSDAATLLSYTAAIFACAWIWRHLSRTAYKH